MQRVIHSFGNKIAVLVVCVCVWTLVDRVNRGREDASIGVLFFGCERYEGGS
jgi:hypothetical protein